jgi:hypothetical protein
MVGKNSSRRKNEAADGDGIRSAVSDENDCGQAGGDGGTAVRLTAFVVVLSFRWVNDDDDDDDDEVIRVM